MAGLMAVWDFMKYAFAMGSNVIWNLLKNGMTLQWRVITIFLYLEMALVLLILLFSIRYLTHSNSDELSVSCLPALDSYWWNAILESQLVKWLDQILKLKIGKTKFKFSYVAFAVFLIFVATRFIGAAWDAIKFSFAMNNSADMRSNPQKEIELLASLYRAQRNFFISGVALFLLLVLHRLNSNLNKQNKHKDNHTDQHSGDSSAYARLKSDYEQLKSKMESTNNEYDRLMKEHATLQRKIKEMEVPFEDKKEK